MADGAAGTASGRRRGALPPVMTTLAVLIVWSVLVVPDRFLRGRDVILAFVESYGRVAVQGSSFSRGVDAVLDAGTGDVRAAGFDSRSAFLTSSTFGGISWLAHATLHSGLWIDSQQRHDQLLSSDRFTLSSAFERAGWRTVVDVPSNRDPWPEGRGSTASMRTTTGTTSATPDRRSASRRCPTSTRWRPSSGWSSRPVMDR
jgi:hypothetical protein